MDCGDEIELVKPIFPNKSRKSYCTSYEKKLFSYFKKYIGLNTRNKSRCKHYVNNHARLDLNDTLIV